MEMTDSHLCWIPFGQQYFFMLIWEFIFQMCFKYVWWSYIYKWVYINILGWRKRNLLNHLGKSENVLLNIGPWPGPIYLYMKYLERWINLGTHFHEKFWVSRSRLHCPIALLRTVNGGCREHNVTLQPEGSQLWGTWDIGTVPEGLLVIMDTPSSGYSWDGQGEEDEKTFHEPQKGILQNQWNLPERYFKFIYCMLHWVPCLFNEKSRGCKGWGGADQDLVS